MAHSFITGSEVINPDEAEAITKHYTSSAQEQATETPDEVDTSPLTDGERESVLEATDDTHQSVFSESGDFRERADTFEIPGTWVHPRLKAQRKQQMMLPSSKTVTDLEERLSVVTRLSGAPKAVADATEKAREALKAVRDAYAAAAHPDNRRFAISTAAKDEVQVKIGEAVSAVNALEALTEDESVREAWFAGLTDGLDKQRADALKALRAAEKAYSVLRSSIGAAQALAIETGKWDKSWHMSTTRDADLNAPVSSMRDAIRFLTDGSDYETGEFLTAEYDGIPPHTLAKLKRGAEVAGGGTFASQVYARALRPMANDKDAQDAISEKRMILLLNSNPTTVELLGKSEDED